MEIKAWKIVLGMVWVVSVCIAVVEYRTNSPVSLFALLALMLSTAIFAGVEKKDKKEEK